MTRRAPRGGTPAPLRLGPNNVLWALACHRGTTPPLPIAGEPAIGAGTGTATTTDVEAMLWRYANRTSPGKIWRMNNNPATGVGTHAGDPAATISTLATTMQTVGQATVESPAILALCGHGIVIGGGNTRWFCLHSGWDNSFSVAVNTEAAWNGYCLPFDWSNRNNNTAYVSLKRAIAGMSNINRVHLYACGMDAGWLSDPMPIGQFAADIQKEVWAYAGLLNVASNGTWLRVIRDHSHTDPMWGCRETSSGYEGVLLNNSRGAMEGWQIRALPSGAVDRTDISEMSTIVEHYDPSGRHNERNDSNISGVPLAGSEGGMVF